MIYTQNCRHILFCAFIFLIGFFSFSESSYAAACTNSFDSTKAAPSGYGAAYNLLSSTKELLVQGTDCTASSLAIQVGSGDTIQYVYKQGYSWNGTLWSPLNLTSTGQLVSEAWYVGKATGSVPAATGGGSSFVVGYVCQYISNAWKCGCSDAICTTPAWQLQEVKINNSGASPSPTPTGGGGSTTCNPQSNILTTGNGSYDAYDCIIIEMANKYGHPDARILKSQAMWESDQKLDVFCTSDDSPCGTKSGWTDAESKSFGLLQVTPACGEGGPALLPNGHPNMTKDTASSLWATSIFNPSVNLDLGIKSIAEAVTHFKQQFSGCDSIQYPLMAAAGYVQDWDTVTGCGQYTDSRQNDYINAVLKWYRTFGQLGNWPDPYPSSV